MTNPTPQELAATLETLERRLVAGQAKCKKCKKKIEQLNRQMVDLRATMTKRDADHAAILLQIVLWITVVVVLGVLIRWPF